jgi:hypothetical protein
MIETKHKIPAEWGLSTMAPIKIAGRLKHYFGYNSPLFAGDTDHWDRARTNCSFQTKIWLDAGGVKKAKQDLRK